MKLLMFGFAAILPVAASADEIFLKSGGQLSGRIVSRTATAIEIDVGAGRIGVPTSSVLRIEEGRSALHEYEDRARGSPPGTSRAGSPWASGPRARASARRRPRRTTARSARRRTTRARTRPWGTCRSADAG